jgi:hypothetical protein
LLLAVKKDISSCPTTSFSPTFEIVQSIIIIFLVYCEQIDAKNSLKSLIAFNI